jgi:hypothetical protein
LPETIAGPIKASNLRFKRLFWKELFPPEKIQVSVSRIGIENVRGK